MQNAKEIEEEKTRGVKNDEDRYPVCFFLYLHIYNSITLFTAHNFAILLSILQTLIKFGFFINEIWVLDFT